VVNIPTSKKSLTKDYITSVNGLLRLTDREIDVITAFIDFDAEQAASSLARKYVAESLEMKSVAVLNNFVKALKDKGVIVADPTKRNAYKYHPIIRNITPDVRVEIRFETQG